MKEYALYKGDEFIAIGSLKELSTVSGIKAKTLRFYATPAHKKRMSRDSTVLVSLDKEDQTE